MKRTTIIAIATAAVGLTLTILVFVGLAPMLRGLAFLGGKPGPIQHGVSFLFAVQTNVLTGAAADDQDMQLAQKSMKRRADKLGYRSEVSVEEKTVRVVLPLTTEADIARARAALTRRGLLEFRLVHEESAKLIAEDLIPAGYTLMKETRTAPDGTKSVIPIIVSRRPVKNLSGRNIAQAHVSRGAMNDPRIAFRFDAAGTSAFATITAENIGKQLAIILDGELYSAPIIRTPITEGSGEISGGSMTEKDVFDLAAMLESPLENILEIMEERRF